MKGLVATKDQRGIWKGVCVCVWGEWLDYVIYLYEVVKEQN